MTSFAIIATDAASKPKITEQRQQQPPLYSRLYLLSQWKQPPPPSPFLGLYLQLLLLLCNVAVVTHHQIHTTTAALVVQIYSRHHCHRGLHSRSVTPSTFLSSYRSRHRQMMTTNHYLHIQTPTQICLSHIGGLATACVVTSYLPSPLFITKPVADVFLYCQRCFSRLSYNRLSLLRVFSSRRQPPTPLPHNSTAATNCTATRRRTQPSANSGRRYFLWLLSSLVDSLSLTFSLFPNLSPTSSYSLYISLSPSLEGTTSSCGYGRPSSPPRRLFSLSQFYLHLYPIQIPLPIPNLGAFSAEQSVQ